MKTPRTSPRPSSRACSKKTSHRRNHQVTKGKFRAFLLARRKTFPCQRMGPRPRAKTRRRQRPAPFPWIGNGRDADERYKIDPADNLSPDKLYDRAWAVTMLERVIIRLRDESHAEGKSKQFEQLKPFLMVGKSDIPLRQRRRRVGNNRRRRASSRSPASPTLPGIAARGNRPNPLRPRPSRGRNPSPLHRPLLNPLNLTFPTPEKH